MAVFAFIREIITSILLAYLSFTNSIAAHIESFFGPEDNTQTVSETTAERPLTQLIDQYSSFGKSIPRVLLEHTEFQRAATIASTRDEADIFVDDGLPVTETVTRAMVNVYCQYKTEDYIRTTTGTGFFINPKGVILTNAHVAQFLLLEDAKNAVEEVSCVIRSGNPAEPKYNAKLLYISPTWVFNNAEVITQESPRGTGERDYALLYVSKTLDNTPLPTRFPAIPVDTALFSRDMEQRPVVTAGYPAGALLRNGASAKLYPVIASTTIGTLYTFGTNYADIFAVSESSVGEQGASGGPIVTPDTERAIGLIVTKGDEQIEGLHSLRALTLSYIDRTITEETGFSLTDNMQGDLALRGSVFKKAMAPFLAGILEEALLKQ